MPHSRARITEIDITRPARALAVLRVSDFVLVLGGGLSTLNATSQSVLAASTAQWADFVIMASMAAAFGAVAYTGWRHVGVIDPRVWRAYLWIFPLLVCVSALGVFALVAASLAQGADPWRADAQSWLALATHLQFAAVALPAFVCVLLLRRMRVAPLGVRLADLLTSVSGHGGETPARLPGVRRISLRRGLAYGILGVVIVLAAQSTPVSGEGRQAANLLRAIDVATALGFVLLIRARRYLQVSADSLLAVDTRPPVLFLRSFADEERRRDLMARRTVLDYSLETRLANHFGRCGPFIAVGSPNDSVPQPGAARVLLSDDQWQARVLDWIKAASLIIMYCGTTKWVNWELRQVVECGRATSLILMFPEFKGWRPWRHKRDVAARVEQIRAIFRDTPWAEELMEFRDFPGLRAMLFRPDGSMLMVRSRSRSREAYHLAALVAHQQLLELDIDPEGLTLHTTAPARGRLRAIGAALATAAVLFVGVYAFGADDRNRLTFSQGELYFDHGVTEEEARRVGEYLVEQGIFNDQKRATVQLDQDQGHCRLWFVVDDPSVVDSTLTTVGFGLLAHAISQDILGGRSIEVVLSDQHLKLLKVVQPSARLAVGKSEIYYTFPVTTSAARAVGEQLVGRRYFTDDAATSVHLSREEETYQLRFIVDPSRINVADTHDAFATFTAQIAAEVLGGEPVVVHLCDQEFRTLNRERVEPTVVVADRRSAS